MTQTERFKYFGACRSSEHLADSFGDHQYVDNDNGEDPDENAADLTDDDPDETRQPS